LATERRQQKVAQFIRKEAALVIRELNDPRVGFITITEVDVTSDLKSAKIYYSVLGSSADKRTTNRAINHAKGFLRKKIGSSLQIKSVPEIEFILITDDEENPVVKPPAILGLIEKARESDPE
jgi:ribosome-binding factor A